MKTRLYATVLTALLIMAMAGSAMCTPTGLPDQAATQAEQKAIDAIQKAIDAKGYNWTAGVTSVSGLTDDEKKKLCGVKPSKDLKDKDLKYKKPKKLDPVGTYPESFDWRNKDGIDWMTSVKGQGSCGSCWAFSAIGAIEAKINIQANNPDLDIDLSEQHLVSTCCDAGDCSEGSVFPALVYIKNSGIPEEACFPYIQQNSPCSPCENWTDSRWQIVDFNTMYGASEFRDKITQHGPISATMVVYSDLFAYTGGVYQHTTGDKVSTHAIVVVGWNDTEGCYIIKNSWGIGWGEDGYGRIPGEYFGSYSAFVVNEIGNYVPDAEVSATPTSGTAPLEVAFTGTGTDSDGTIVSHEWTFGDGASSTSQNPTHTYTGGTYTATLTVTDDGGLKRSDSMEITAIPADCNPWDDDGIIEVSEIMEAITLWEAQQAPYPGCPVVTASDIMDMITIWQNQ